MGRPRPRGHCSSTRCCARSPKSTIDASPSVSARRSYGSRFNGASAVWRVRRYRPCASIRSHFQGHRTVAASRRSKRIASIRKCTGGRTSGAAPTSSTSPARTSAHGTNHGRSGSATWRRRSPSRSPSPPPRSRPTSVAWWRLSPGRARSGAPTATCRWPTGGSRVVASSPRSSDGRGSTWWAKVCATVIRDQGPPARFERSLGLSPAQRPRRASRP
jgi:hypothetical protein